MLLLHLTSAQQNFDQQVPFSPLPKTSTWTAGAEKANNILLQKNNVQTDRVAQSRSGAKLNAFLAISAVQVHTHTTQVNTHTHKRTLFFTG